MAVRNLFLVSPSPACLPPSCAQPMPDPPLLAPPIVQAAAGRAKADALQFMDYQNMRGGKVRAGCTAAPF